MARKGGAMGHGYIVVYGMEGGYMPNSCQWCASLKEAYSAAAWLREEAREAECKVTGNIRKDRLQVVDCGRSLNDYIEIVDAEEEPEEGEETSW
jgi:hypothetical protein